MNEIATQFTQPAVKDSANSLVEQAKRAEVTDRDTYAKAGDLDRWLSQTLKKADEERRSWVDPLNAQVKRINDSFRPLTTALEGARRTLKGKMLAWEEEEEKKRQTEIEAQRKAAEDDAVTRAAEQEAAGDVEGAENTLATAGEVQAPSERVGAVHGSFASSSSQKRRDFEVVKISDLPVWALEAIEANEKAMSAIKTALRGEVIARDKRGETISGVRCFDKKTITTR